MHIEVVYARPETQTLIALDLPEGATVGQALAAVATQPPFNTLPLDAVPVGVYGRSVSREQALAPYDRVEIYRPLEVDPIAARRARSLGG